MGFVAASEHALTIAKIAAQAAYDKKAEDIVLLDVSEHLVITDIFLIVSADNERQVGAVVDAIEAALDEIDVETNSIPRGVSGSDVVVNWPTPAR